MSYKKQSIRITDLLVNPENPRFDPVKDQRRALGVMIENIKPKIKNLADDIAKNGLNPGKSWYVEANNGKYVVLEGNRRLTAIKLINNPKIIKLDKETEDFFQNLKNNFGKNLPSRVDCAVFTNKEDAYHWIELEHTGENKGVGLVRWNSEQTNRFKSQISGSKLTRGVQVLDFMRDNTLDVHNIDVTNIDRLVSTPYVREQIGLDFKDGSMALDKSKKNVVNNLKKVSSSMSETNFNVGKIYTADQRKKWIDETLSGKQPTTADVTPLGVKDKEDDTGQKTTEQKSSTDRQTLIPTPFRISISQNRINLIYKELKKLSVDDFRNAVAVLFRVFLELSVDHFITDKKPKGIDLSKQPALSKKLEVVSQYMEDNKLLTKNELKVIRTAASNKNSIFSADTFNSYIHNLNNIPVSNDLKISWDNIEKFIEKLWE